MLKKDFLQKIKDILQTEESIVMDTKLESLEEWDSLAKIATIAFLDREFNLKATVNELSDCLTVSDIANKVGVK